MVQDQRFAHHRPDVLSYETDPLTEDVIVAGSRKVKLFGSTSGTDCDWIVRLIDVYPEDNKPNAEMSGYQLLIAGEPVRARFRKSLEKPEAVKPGAVEPYTIDLNWGHHRFRKGHRIMIQVSSTWFPVIDRNPQKFVPNIFEAVDADFQKATQPRVPLREIPVARCVGCAEAGRGRSALHARPDGEPAMRFCCGTRHTRENRNARPPSGLACKATLDRDLQLQRRHILHPPADAGVHPVEQHHVRQHAECNSQHRKR